MHSAARAKLVSHCSGTESAETLAAAIFFGIFWRVLRVAGDPTCKLVCVGQMGELDKKPAKARALLRNGETRSECNKCRRREEATERESAVGMITARRLRGTGIRSRDVLEVQAQLGRLAMVLVWVVLIWSILLGGTQKGTTVRRGARLGLLGARRLGVWSCVLHSVHPPRRCKLRAVRNIILYLYTSTVRQ